MVEKKKTTKKKTGKLIKIQAYKSGDEFIVFSRASTIIRDPKTGEILVEPRGGKAHIKAKIIELL